MIPARQVLGPLLIVIGALTVSGCAYFEVDPDRLPDGHDEHASDEHDHEDDTPPIDGAPQVRVVADAMRFEPSVLELSAGEPVNISLEVVDVLHDLTVDEAGFHVGAGSGETVTGGLVLDEPGSYVGYCSVPGHREAGMEVEIVVE